MSNDPTEGARTKRPYVRRATREEEAVREPARPTKQRLRRGTFQNIYGISQDVLSALWTDHGVDLQWNLDTVKGADGREVHDLPFSVTRIGMEQQGWESVMPGMFGGLLDGLFTKREHVGEIVVGGQVLQWRPRELTEEARAEDKAAAKHAVGINEKQWQTGNIPGVDHRVLDPNHGGARGATRLTKARIPSIPVPQ